MATKLVLVEGLPGTGKSTTAKYIKNFLESKGLKTEVYCEGNYDNPADFEGVSFLPMEELKRIIKCHPQLSGIIDSYCAVNNDLVSVSYGKLRSENKELVNQDIMEEFFRYDVYEGLPLEAYMDLTKARWKSFIENTKNKDCITVLECCFLQNPITSMLGRHDVEVTLIKDHIRGLADIIKKHEPLLIYLYQDDIRNAIDNVRKERPDAWFDFVTEYITKQGYGKRVGMEGYDGVINFFSTRRDIEAELLKELKLKAVVVDNSEVDWDKCRKEIESVIYSNCCTEVKKDGHKTGHF